MKANEFPETIYLTTFGYPICEPYPEESSCPDTVWSTRPYSDSDTDSIEYTRTDAFIEKACDAYCKVCGHYAHTTPNHICRQACDYYRDFRTHIKRIEEEEDY